MLILRNHKHVNYMYGFRWVKLLKQLNFLLQCKISLYLRKQVLMKFVVFKGRGRGAKKRSNSPFHDVTPTKKRAIE